MLIVAVLATTYLRLLDGIPETPAFIILLQVYRKDGNAATRYYPDVSLWRHRHLPQTTL